MDNVSERFYRLCGRRLWGDYGDMLIHGCVDDSQTPLEVARTGPFVPPVTLPRGMRQHLILTDGLRMQLEESGLGSFRFEPVAKGHIVDVPWESWDWGADEARWVPESAEPEDYLDLPHSPMIADAMGNLWEVVLRDGALVDTEIRRAPWDYDVRVHVSTWNGDSLFRGYFADRRPGPYLIASQAAKEWLEGTVGEWLRFLECPVQEGEVSM